MVADASSEFKPCAFYGHVMRGLGLLTGAILASFLLPFVLVRELLLATAFTWRRRG